MRDPAHGAGGTRRFRGTEWHTGCTFPRETMGNCARRVTHAEVAIPAAGVELAADLALPDDAIGLVLFAHGSGSSRHSPRNRMVAEVLNRGGIATLLADLLTSSEDKDDRASGEYRFNIEMLTDRLTAITGWTREQEHIGSLPLGYFGASTGAAAALGAAANCSSASAAGPGASAAGSDASAAGSDASAGSDERVRAIVSRGGRPDLAGSALGCVHAPCLFIVGGDDSVVVQLNQESIRQLPLSTEHRLEIIPGATHLFEEQGALDQVARLARNWFQRYLPAATTGGSQFAGTGRREATTKHDACTENRISQHGNCA